MDTLLKQAFSTKFKQFLGKFIQCNSAKTFPYVLLNMASRQNTKLVLLKPPCKLIGKYPQPQITWYGGMGATGSYYPNIRVK